MQTLLTTHRCHTFTVANSDHCCKTDKPQYWENQTYPFSTLTPHLFTPRPLPTTTTTHTTCPYLRIVLSRLVVYDCDPMDCGLPASSVHGDSPGKNTGVGCHALLQEIFPTQGSNPGLLYRRQILYHLRYQGSPVPSINRAEHSSLSSALNGSGLPRLWLLQTRSCSLLLLLISISKHKTLLLTLDFWASGLLPDFSFHMGAVDHLSAQPETQHSHTLLHRLDASQPTLQSGSAWPQLPLEGKRFL